VLEHKEILIPEVDLPVLYARDFTIFIILVIAAVILFEKSLRDTYRRLVRELQERKETEEKLSQNERKLLEQKDELLVATLKAEESDRLKTAFLQNISHEIRTPMNDIIGLSELIREEGASKEERLDYINKLLLCSDQLVTLIDDLINVSKLETGMAEISESVFQAGLLLEDLRIKFAGRASEKGLRFSIINELGNTVIKSDMVKISQVINNLTDNAIKFTPSGEVKIHGSIRGNLLSFEFSDTGIGIAREEARLIFSHFRQSEFGVSRAYRGAGLGLSICKGNLDFLGGEINVESELGKGSLFTVTIPVKFPDDGTG